MRAVVQRVAEADVVREGSITGAIRVGLLVFLGVEEGDEEKDARYMAEKIAGLRIFEDREGKMNRSVKDVGGRVLAISQFTLLGDARRGKRPSFTRAARPDQALGLYRVFIDLLAGQEIQVEEGVFQAEMLVRIHNDGTVTILLDSRKTF